VNRPRWLAWAAIILARCTTAPDVTPEILDARATAGTENVLSAVVTLDDTRVRETELVVPKDDATHRLRITAAGYVAHDETIAFTESQRLVVQLKRVAGSVRVGKDKDPHDKDPRKDHPERPQPPELIESTSPYQQPH